MQWFSAAWSYNFVSGLSWPHGFACPWKKSRSHKNTTTVQITIFLKVPRKYELSLFSSTRLIFGCSSKPVATCVSEDTNSGTNYIMTWFLSKCHPCKTKWFGVSHTFSKSSGQDQFLPTLERPLRVWERSDIGNLARSCRVAIVKKCLSKQKIALRSGLCAKPNYSHSYLQKCAY